MRNRIIAWILILSMTSQHMVFANPIEVNNFADQPINTAQVSQMIDSEEISKTFDENEDVFTTLSKRLEDATELLETNIEENDLVGIEQTIENTAQLIEMSRQPLEEELAKTKIHLEELGLNTALERQIEFENMLWDRFNSTQETLERINGNKEDEIVDVEIEQQQSGVKEDLTNDEVIESDEDVAQIEEIEVELQNNEEVEQNEQEQPQSNKEEVKNEDEIETNEDEVEINQEQQIEEHIQSIEVVSQRDDKELAKEALEQLKSLISAKDNIGELGNDLVSSPVMHPQRRADLSSDITPAYLSGSKTYDSKTNKSEKVDIEDEIKELALSLKTPTNAYSYVKNNIKYEPYYGVRRGAKGTLYEARGNDYDQSALLVKLLQAQGYEAEFVRGTMYIEIEDIKNWVGTYTEDSAITLLSNAGIPITPKHEGGRLVGAYVERVWVQAKVPYTNYRGIGDIKGEEIWLPLDVAYKFTSLPTDEEIDAILNIDKDYAASMVDFSADINENSISNFKIEGIEELNKYIGDQLLGSLENDTSQSNDFYNDNLKEYIEPQYLSVLPNTLECEVSAVLNEWNEIPIEYNESATFKMKSTGISGAMGSLQEIYSDTTANLYGKTIGITYKGTTKEDEAIINSYGSILNTPLYLISVTPQLTIDGVVVANGPSSIAGNNQIVYTSIIDGEGTLLGNGDNTIISGGVYCLTLDYGGYGAIGSNQVKDDLNELIEKVSNSNTVTDQDITKLLYGIGKIYSSETKLQQDTAQMVLKIKSVGDTSIIMTDMLPTLQSLFVPIKATGTSLAVDITTLVGNSVEISSNSDLDTYNSVMNTLYSYMEGYVLEVATGVTSVSTVSILNTSMELGLEIYSLDSSNVNDLNNLNINRATKNTIRNYINAGNTVIVPESDITIGDWSGTGYIVTSADGLSNGYYISGGLAGGQSTEHSLLADIFAVVMIVMLMAIVMLTYVNAMLAGAVIFGTIQLCLSTLSIAFALVNYIQSADLQALAFSILCSAVISLAGVRWPDASGFVGAVNDAKSIVNYIGNNLVSREESKPLAKYANKNNINVHSKEGSQKAQTIYNLHVELNTGENIKGVVAPTPQTPPPNNPQLTQDYTSEEKAEIEELLISVDVEQEMISKFLIYAAITGMTMIGGRGVITAYYIFIEAMEEKAQVDEIWFVYPDEDGYYNEESVETITALLKVIGEDDEDITDFIAFGEEEELIIAGSEDLFMKYFMYISSFELLEKVG